MRDPEDVPANKPKKIYRKPKLKTLDPQAAIKMLKPLALAGDKDARLMIKATPGEHEPGTNGRH